MTTDALIQAILTMSDAYRTILELRNRVLLLERALEALQEEVQRAATSPPPSASDRPGQPS